MDTHESRPLRVLYYYGAQHVDSGSPKALLGLIDIIDRRRVTPFFLAGKPGPLVDELQARDVGIIWSAEPRAMSYRRAAASVNGVRAFRRVLQSHRIDVLHINELGWNQDIVLSAYLTGIPVVLQVHLPEKIYSQNLNPRLARRILLVSEAQKQAIEDFERIRAKTEILYNAVDLDRFASGRNIRQELGLDRDDVVVGTLAQLRHGKGIDIMIGVARELIPRYPRLVFVVAGRIGHGEEDYGRALIAEMGDPKLQGRFRYLGSRQDIPDILASLDVFMLPSRAETFGIAIVEAMAAGLPVIASRVGAIPEILVSPEVGSVVDKLDVESFKRAVKAIITLPDVGRGMGERGRLSLNGRFDRDSLSKTLHAIYGRLPTKR